MVHTDLAARDQSTPKTDAGCEYKEVLIGHVTKVTINVINVVLYL